MFDCDHPFSETTAPDFRTYAQKVQSEFVDIEKYVERNGGKSHEPVIIDIQGRYAVLYRERDWKQIGFANGNVSGMLSIWQVRHPNHQFL